MRFDKIINDLKAKRIIYVVEFGKYFVWRRIATLHLDINRCFTKSYVALYYIFHRICVQLSLCNYKVQKIFIICKTRSLNYNFDLMFCWNHKYGNKINENMNAYIFDLLNVTLLNRIIFCIIHILLFILCNFGSCITDFIFISK